MILSLIINILIALFLPISGPEATPSAPPGAWDDPDTTVVFPVEGEWALVSLPVNPLRKSVFPIFYVRRAFSYEPGYGYVPVTDLEPGKGYWVKIGGYDEISVRGKPRWRDTLQVREGWNLVGTLSVPVPRSSLYLLPDGRITAVAGRGADGTYNSSVSTLLPGNAYWIRVSMDGKLVLAP